MTIKFGTSGWRAVIAEDFTFDGVRRVTAAIGRLLEEKGDAGRGVVVSYDTRFFADRFAWAAADELVRRGIDVRLTDRDTPTPVVAHAVIRGNHGGAINLTASHNPPQYCGLKFSPASGAPALDEETSRIAELANGDIEVHGSGAVELEDLLKHDRCEVFSPQDPYMAALERLVDRPALEANPPRVVVDCLYGTARGYLAEFLMDCGCPVKVLHAYRDAYFGGHTPEPSGRSLARLCETVRESDAVLGLACDGDADRFGVVDAEGHYVDANLIFALIFRHLAEHRGLEGDVARSAATTHLIDALARHLGRRVVQTPVGIKHLAELVIADKVMLGGEESAGVCLRGHVPDKDGILACALVAEMLAVHGKSLRGLIEDLFVTVGRRYLNGRLNLRLTPELAPRIRQQISAEAPSTFAGVAVREVDRTDGLKLLLADDTWAMLRPSGTEPLIRFYAEAHDEGRLDDLVQAARELLGVE